MGRLRQLFIAPGPEDDELPTPPSAWHGGRLVALPMEHWELILDFAAKLDAAKAEALRRYSYPEDGQLQLPGPQLDEMLTFLDRLRRELPLAPALAPERTEDIPEPFPNTEHVLMVNAVAAVLAEARRLDQAFEADVDA